MGNFEKDCGKGATDEHPATPRRRWLLGAGTAAVIGGQAGAVGRASAQSTASPNAIQGAIAGQDASDQALEVIYDLAGEQLAQMRTDCSSRGSYPTQRTTTTYPTQQTTTRTVSQPVPVYYPSTGMGQTCFVATVAFEDANAPEVVKLRRFRDTILARHGAGRRFIRWYYRAGPGLSVVLGGGPVRRSLVRLLLRALIVCLPGTGGHR